MKALLDIEALSVRFPTARGDVHDPLKREVELRAAIAAIEADRRAVRDHELVVDRDVLHAVAAVGGGVHTVERGRLGRADIGAHVGGVVEMQGLQLAVPGERCRHRSHSIARGRGRRGEA